MRLLLALKWILQCCFPSTQPVLLSNDNFTDFFLVWSIPDNIQTTEEVYPSVFKTVNTYSTFYIHIQDQQNEMAPWLRGENLDQPVTLQWRISPQANMIKPRGPE